MTASGQVSQLGFEKLKFFNLNQLDGEKFFKYISRLKAQSTACDFCSGA